jgi:hypothetical protein
VHPGVNIVPKQKEEDKMGKLRCIVLVLVLLIAGCAKIEVQKQMSLFDETIRAYDRAIRWGEYEEAFAYKKLSDQDNKLPDFSEYRQIKVTAYKVKKTILDEESFSKVMRFVDIQYYRMSNVTVKTLIDRQKWEYNEEVDRWYLMSDLPTFE